MENIKNPASHRRVALRIARDTQDHFIVELSRGPAYRFPPFYSHADVLHELGALGVDCTNLHESPSGALQDKPAATLTSTDEKATPSIFNGTVMQGKTTHDLVDLRLPLGRIVATPGALTAIEQADVSLSLLIFRHANHDWGELCPADRDLNTLALQVGGRVLSSYPLPDESKVWVITSADRSLTTVLLPSEY